MSASLVGSEMCIRDSLSDPVAPSEPTCGMQPGEGTSQGAGGAPPATGPVSYTHLTLPTICSV
eukprot:13585286-Alexandrium_andersonii.AAC.1